MDTRTTNLASPSPAASAEPGGDDYFGHEHLTVIEPRKGWRLVDVKELWAYRELFWVLTLRDVKVRYKQTVLGFAWAILQPVMTMVVFSVIFGGFARLPSDGVPYPVFVYCGLLPWTFFAGSLSRAGNSVVGASNLISKVYFPRLVIPLSSVGSGLVDLAISTCVLLVLMLLFGVAWSFNLLAAPLLLVLVAFAALGVGTFLSALNVAYRDFGLLTPFLVQLWMYATPVIYPLSLVPERWRWLFYLNPMTGVIEGFRAAFLGKPFVPATIALSMLISLALFAFGLAYFRKVEHRFADII